MKKPRISDFDPDAKTPPLKSSLDGMPPIVKPDATNRSPAPVEDVSSGLRGSAPQSASKGANPRPVIPQLPKRPYVRRTFDFYEDQIAYLTRESLQERLAGNEVSMNAMIREAIDDWIKKRTSKK